MKTTEMPGLPATTRHTPARYIAALCGVGCALLSVAVAALTVVPRPFPELVEQAEVVVVGTVASSESAWSADHTTIYTSVRLVDLDVIKGAVPAVPYELRLPGGVVGDTAQRYPGMPALEQGGRYVLFVRGNLHELIPLVGAYQGLYRVLTDSAGRQRVLRANQRDTPFMRAVVLPAQPTLEEFVARVRDQMGAAGAASAP